MKQESAPALSIIIVSFQVRDYVLGCLRSLDETVRRHPFEVVLVDNRSDDGTVDAVRRAFPRTRVIENRVNAGFAAACNQGLAQSRGRWLLLLNPDTVALPGAIDDAVDFLAGHPQAGMAGCMILNADGSLQPSCRNLPALWISLIENLGLHPLLRRLRLLRRVYLRNWAHDRERPVDSVQGSFMLTSRAVVDRIGPLDEGFFFYGEEVDWQKRLALAGLPLYFLPQCRIIHYGGASSAVMPVRALIELHRGLHRYDDKYFSPAAALADKTLYALGIALRLAGAALMGLWPPARAAARPRRAAFGGVARWYLAGAPRLDRFTTSTTSSTEKERSA